MSFTSHSKWESFHFWIAVCTVLQFLGFLSYFGWKRLSLKQMIINNDSKFYSNSILFIKFWFISHVDQWRKKNLMAFSHSSVSGSCLLSLSVLVSAQQQSYVEFYVIIIGNQMTWILVTTLALCSLYTASPKSLLVIAITKLISICHMCVCVSWWRRYCCSIIFFLSSSSHRRFFFISVSPYKNISKSYFVQFVHLFLFIAFAHIGFHNTFRQFRKKTFSIEL